MPAPGRRMLIVDDEDAVRFAVSEYFHHSGYEVDTAAEKEEAEALLANGSYSVVLADLRLTGFAGVEGLDVISFALECCPGVRVVILTGHATAEVEKEALRRGAAALLHKPVPLPELARVVESLTASAR